jgi:hypothetical protein
MKEAERAIMPLAFLASINCSPPRWNSDTSDFLEGFVKFVVEDVDYESSADSRFDAFTQAK